MTNILDVYLHTELVGTLVLGADDQMTFSYSKNATKPISVGMPLDIAAIGNAHCEAFFGGLLPEGDDAKKALGKRLGISADNTFSLLRAIGAECAGALSILEPGSPAPTSESGEIKILGDDELAQLIRDLPQRPLFVGVNGLRLSLAGYQDKAAVSIVSDAIGIPSHGATTHILKPDLKRSQGVIYCEYLCMKVAARLALEVAVVDLRKAEDQAFLLVKRYDRISKNDSSHLERVHQEDFCQAMAIPSKKKYQDEGGPTLKACFELLAKTAVPAKSRISLLKAVIFNFLVSNFDAHGKNFSLLHSAKGVVLAPLYDVTCTAAFPDYAHTLAMEIGDSFKPDEIRAYQWKTLCEDIGFSYRSFRNSAKRLCQTLPEEADAVYSEMKASGWSHPKCEDALNIIRTNCVEMQSRLGLRK